MVDINIVKVGQKTYSIKTRNEFFENDEIKVIILNIDEVSMSSNTSYTKLKNVWVNPTNNDSFDSIKYNDIYQALIKKLISKYRMKKLII